MDKHEVKREERVRDDSACQCQPPALFSAPINIRLPHQHRYQRIMIAQGLGVWKWQGNDSHVSTSLLTHHILQPTRYACTSIAMANDRSVKFKAERCFGLDKQSWLRVLQRRYAAQRQHGRGVMMAECRLTLTLQGRVPVPALSMDPSRVSKTQLPLDVQHL